MESSYLTSDNMEARQVMLFYMGTRQVMLYDVIYGKVYHILSCLSDPDIFPTVAICRGRSRSGSWAIQKFPDISLTFPDSRGMSGYVGVAHGGDLNLKFKYNFKYKFYNLNINFKI